MESNVYIPEKFKNHPLFTKRIKGMNFGFLSKRGYYARKDVLKQPEIMAEMGVNCITLNLNICQEKYCSTKIYLDFEYSVGELELKNMTDKCHEFGISVILKPCMTCMDSRSMGMVSFPDVENQIEGVCVDYWKEWFDSYKACLKYSANLAQDIGMDALMIGAELFGTERKEKHWRDVIKEVRERFDGPITYEFTPDSKKLHDLNWVNEMDFISYSYYPPACDKTHINDPENNPVYSYDDIYNYLLPRRKRIHELHERFGNKPVLFTEHGVRSVHGGIMEPYRIDIKTWYDGQEQADFMKASYEVFNVLPEWMGFLWWKWDETQNRPHYHHPDGDCGFTIQGKPAEKVFRELGVNK